MAGFVIRQLELFDSAIRDLVKWFLINLIKAQFELYVKHRLC